MQFCSSCLGNSSNFYVSMFIITNSSNFCVQRSRTDADEVGTFFVQSAGNIVTFYIFKYGCSCIDDNMLHTIGVMLLS
jgi:hypothetical protein